MINAQIPYSKNITVNNAPTLESLRFPDDFVFGTATSAFQVEGSTGKRDTDWDEYFKNHANSIKPEEIGPNWWTAGVAEKDISAMSALGTKTIRISLEWARIEPEKGFVEKQAIDRYHEIIDYIHSLGMIPMVTINHLTLPLWVAKRGGWENRKMPGMFAYFVELIISHFTDVFHWVTINEPNILLQAGYLTSYFPPYKTNLGSAIVARRNMLLAHKKAYAVIKHTIPSANVGLAISFRWYRPENAGFFAERWYASLVNYIDSLNFIDATADTSDFIGCNYYSGYYLDLNLKHTKLTMRRDAAGIPETILFGEIKKPGAYTSDMGWPIVADFFLDVLRAIRKRSNKPIIITENGIADYEDKYRAFYILTHLIAVWKALQEGIPIRQYIHWSTIDNIEWLYGYKKQFGLLKLNPMTGERTLRHSANLYKEIITTKKIDVNNLVGKYIPSDQRPRVWDVIALLSTSK
ncbi:MAG: glycoside hydrolase family 1 protein [Candidatus Levybacteria bacterium]|nr:glycoside hydrolase family 1 protein [Candidatus Levybacteria bacterium]